MTFKQQPINVSITHNATAPNIDQILPFVTQNTGSPSIKKHKK